MENRGDGTSVQSKLWIGILIFYTVLATFVLSQAA